MEHNKIVKDQENMLFTSLDETDFDYELNEEKLVNFEEVHQMV